MARIAISGGHGYDTAGKRTPSFPKTNKVIKEWEFNHPTSRYLKKVLEDEGHEVLMVSDTQRDTPLRERVALANAWGADVYISIHYNAFQGVWGTHGGLETLCHETSKSGQALAESVHSELIKATGLRNRGVKTRPHAGKLRLAELSDTKMPAVLVECGFMDNLEEASLMLDANYQMLCASSIAKGINKIYPLPEDKSPKPTITLDILGHSRVVEGRTIDGTAYITLDKQDIPVRKLFNHLGFEVGWDSKSREIIIKEER